MGCADCSQMTIIETTPALNLKERGIQIDLRTVGEDGGLPKENHLAVVAPPRSHGIHCSSLIRSIAINNGWLKVMQENHGSRFNLAPVIDEEDFPLIMSIGMAWEDWISRQYPNMLYHFGELELDGISMSPDGVEVPHDGSFDFDLGTGIIDEFKLTWKSSRKPIEQQKMWLMQVKAYCKALPTLCARLHVVWVNGDYDYKRPGMPPQYRVYHLQFTQEELDANWQMLLTELAEWRRQGLVD